MIDWTTVEYDAMRLQDEYKSSYIDEVVDRLSTGERSKELYNLYANFYVHTRLGEETEVFELEFNGVELDCNIKTLYYMGDGTRFQDSEGFTVPNLWDYINPTDLYLFKHHKEDLILHKTAYQIVELMYPDDRGEYDG